MTQELFRRVILYQTTMSVFVELRNRGVIGAEELLRIDAKIAEKYGLDTSVIYRREP